MNRSAAELLLLPPTVVTVMSTAPAEFAGAVAVTEVALFTVTLVAAVAPNFTAVVPVRLVPVMVTKVPAVSGPEAGLIAVTVGAGTYVYWSDAPVPLVPPTVATVISTVPAEFAGAVAVTEVALFTVTLVAAVAPNFTAVVPVRFVPMIVTWVPAVSGPYAGLIDVMVGAATKVYWSDAPVVLLPPTVVTVTSTVPAEPAGAVAVTEVALFTVTLIAALVPKFTEVVPVRFVPVTVTEVPAVSGPDAGLIEVTVGAATNVY